MNNTTDNDAHGVPLHRFVRRWAVQFTATRGEMTGTIKMGALGDTWEDACQFVRTHCAGQYDSIGEITEILPNADYQTKV